MSASQPNSKQKMTSAKRIISVLDGSFLTRDNMMNNMVYLLFLFLLGILYIGNSHYAEKTVIEMDRLDRELKELRSEFITTRSELMMLSKQSEVARAVEQMGIYESVTPPKKIVVQQDELTEQ